MTVAVRTYQTLGDPEEGERFAARVIAMDRKGREGPSVFLYAATAEEVEAKAYAWIEAERRRVETIAGNKAMAAIKNSRIAAEKKAARS